MRLKKRKLPSGREFHFARFKDPDTNKIVDLTLDTEEGLNLTTREARRQWAIAKSEALARRRADLATGAPVKTHTPLSEAVETYLEACSNRLRDRTVEIYRKATDTLVTWAGDNGISEAGDLTPGRPATFRESRVSQRRQTVAAGDKRGARKASPATRSPGAVNVALCLNPGNSTPPAGSGLRTATPGGCSISWRRVVPHNACS